MNLHVGVAGLALALGMLPAHGDAIVRHQAGNFPIASSVVVPAGTQLVFVSGTLADVANPDAPVGSVERLGNTEVQAASVLGKISRELEASGLTLGDVVKMGVFLVGDPAQDGKMDFAGLMKAYTRYFGTEDQQRLPTRTTVQVTALPLPGALVEIEVIAANVPAAAD